MLLFEFTEQDPKLTDLVAAVGQLKSSIDAGKKKPEWTVDELIKYLKDVQPTLNFDKEFLLNASAKPPLNQFIENIQGDNIIFKGQGAENGAGTADDDQNKKIVKQMAARATP